MTADTRPLQWDRLTWHARTKALDNLARTEARLRQSISQLATERDELNQRVERLRGELDQVELFVDLRRNKAATRIIWERDDLWSPSELLAAHASYVAGSRDEWTVTGHRIWDKQRKRARRETCPECGGPKALGSQRCTLCRRGIDRKTVTT